MTTENLSGIDLDNNTGALWLSLMQSDRVVKFDQNAELRVQVDERRGDSGSIENHSKTPGYHSPERLVVNQHDGSLWLVHVLPELGSQLSKLSSLGLPIFDKTTSREALYPIVQTPDQQFLIHAKFNIYDPPFDPNSDVTVIVGHETYVVNFKGKDSEFVGDSLMDIRNNNLGPKHKRLENIPAEIEISNKNIHLQANGGSYMWLGGQTRARKYDLDGNLLLESKANSAGNAFYIEKPTIAKNNESLWYLGRAGQSDVSSTVSLDNIAADGTVLAHSDVHLTSLLAGPDFHNYQLVSLAADSVDGGVWLANYGVRRYLSDATLAWNIDYDYAAINNEIGFRLSEPGTQVVAQQEYYDQVFVSALADSTVADGSELHPFNTIQKAIDTALEGETIWVGPGIYDENLTINKSVHLRGSGVDNTVVTSGIVAMTVPYLTIQGFKISGSGVSCHNCGNVEITKNVIINDPVIAAGNVQANQNGITITTDPKSTPLIDWAKATVLIEQNEIKQNNVGILVDNFVTVVIRNNVIASNFGDGIDLKVGDNQALSSTLVQNNLIDANGGFGIQPGPLNQARSFSFINNIVTSNKQGGMLLRFEEISQASSYPHSVNNSFALTTLSNNNFFTNLPADYVDSKAGLQFNLQENRYSSLDNATPDKMLSTKPYFIAENNISEQPQYVDFDAGDYRLAPGSPGHNAGTSNENFDAIEACGSENRRNDMGATGGPWGKW